MVIDSEGVTATQEELRATAKARRNQKRRAKREARREAERSNSGKSLNRVLKVFTLAAVASVMALLEVY